MKFNIYWLTPDRFDRKRDKSTWVEMTKALIDRGHSVKIIASKSKNKKSTAEYDQFIAYVGSIDLPLIFRISVLFNMYFWLRKNAIPTDVIIINQDALLITPLLKLIGIKNIHVDIRTIPVDTHSIKDHLDKLLYWKIPLKLLGKSIGSYSFITERLREEVEREFKLDISDYSIWQSGVSTETFYPIKNRYLGQKKIRLFYHGTISVNRGIGLVIEAMNHLEDNLEIEFVIAGKGVGLEELKLLTNKFGVDNRVSFLGMLPYEKMVEEINKSDVCICPLTDRLEWNVSSPIKVFEYMACAKPIILTPISAHKDVASNQPYIVWTEGFKPADFAKAILISIENLSKLSEEAKTAPNYVSNHFQWKNQADKLDNYLQKSMPASMNS